MMKMLAQCACLGLTVDHIHGTKLHGDAGAIKAVVRNGLQLRTGSQERSVLALVVSWAGARCCAAGYGVDWNER